MLKEILRSMLHNRWRTLVILLLSFISFVLSLLALTNSFTLQSQQNAVKKLFTKDIDNTYIVNVSYIESEENAGVNLYEIKEFSNKLPNVICGAYDESGEYLEELTSNSAFVDCNEIAYQGTDRQGYPKIAEVLFVDPSILQIIANPLEENSLTIIEKNNKKYLPIYVGKDFESIINIGDTLTLKRSNQEYIVQGYLEELNWFHDSDVITMPTISLEHKFLAPFSIQDTKDAMTQMSTMGKIFIYSKNPENIQVIKDYAMELGIKTRIVSVSESMEQWKQDNLKLISLNIYFAVVVLSCSIISMISILCVSILLQKREYGIRYAFGTTKGHIMTGMCIETMVLFLISGTMAYLLLYKRYSNPQMSIFYSIYIHTFNTISLPCLIGLSLIMILIIMLIPLIILSRYQPAELIKEEDQ